MNKNGGKKGKELNYGSATEQRNMIFMNNGKRYSFTVEIDCFTKTIMGHRLDAIDTCTAGFDDVAVESHAVKPYGKRRDMQKMIRSFLTPPDNRKPRK